MVGGVLDSLGSLCVVSGGSWVDCWGAQHEGWITVEGSEKEQEEEAMVWKLVEVMVGPPSSPPAS